MDSTQPRIILIDVCDESREIMARRLNAQGYTVETAADATSGADLALTSPPSAVIADLWMPSISGVQLCRLLRAEPATAEVPIILRGPTHDPRSRFWAERAGAVGYVVKGCMGELVRTLAKAVNVAPSSGAFFMQLSGGSVDIRDRIARHLDAALFESVIAGEVRALASCGSFERVFDIFSQFLSQVIPYRWLALATQSPEQFAIHLHPHAEATAEAEARHALGLPDGVRFTRIIDEDASSEPAGMDPVVCSIPFGAGRLGQLALAPTTGAEQDTVQLVGLVARELGGPIRIAALMEESQRLATVDPLTGLMNRRAFLSAMQVELSRSSRYSLPLSLLLLDVDHFKAINDTYGHAAGDQVLGAIGNFLREDLRIPDSAARWGGEEFVIALTNTDLQGGTIVGERIRTGLSELEIMCGSRQVKITVSIGLALCRSTDTVDQLIDRADRAMYAAKVGGRNKLMLEEELRGGESPSQLAKVG